MKNAKRLGLQGLVLASGLALTGCNTLNSGEQYKANVRADLKENSFSDEDFSIERSEAKLSTGNYVFGRISPNDIVTAADGRQIPHNELFPFWAVRTNEMTEHIFPQKKEVVYGRPDGKVRIFVKDNGIKYLSSNQGFERPKLDEDEKVGNVGEAEFRIPTVNFNIQGFDSVPYSGFKDQNGNLKIVLIQGASYRLNNARGGVDIFGDSYFVETLGEIESKKTGFTMKDIIRDVKPVYKGYLK